MPLEDMLDPGDTLYTRWQVRTRLRAMYTAFMRMLKMVLHFERLTSQQTDFVMRLRAQAMAEMILAKCMLPERIELVIMCHERLPKAPFTREEVALILTAVSQSGGQGTWVRFLEMLLKYPDTHRDTISVLDAIGFIRAICPGTQNAKLSALGSQMARIATPHALSQKEPLYFMSDAGRRELECQMTEPNKRDEYIPALARAAARYLRILPGRATSSLDRLIQRVMLSFLREDGTCVLNISIRQCDSWGAILTTGDVAKSPYFRDIEVVVGGTSVSRACALLYINPMGEQIITFMPTQTEPHVVVTPSTENDVIAAMASSPFSPFVRNLFELCVRYDVKVSKEDCDGLLHARGFDIVEAIAPYGSLQRLLLQHRRLFTYAISGAVLLMGVTRLSTAVDIWNKEYRLLDRPSLVLQPTCPSVCAPRAEISDRGYAFLDLMRKCSGYPLYLNTDTRNVPNDGKLDFVTEFGLYMSISSMGYFLTTTHSQTRCVNPHGLYPNPGMGYTQRATLGHYLAYALTTCVPLPFKLSPVFLNMLVDPERREHFDDPLALAHPTLAQQLANPAAFIGDTWFNPYGDRPFDDGIIETMEDAEEYADLLRDAVVGAPYEESVVADVLSAMSNSIIVENLRKWHIEDLYRAFNVLDAPWTLELVAELFPRAGGSAEAWPQGQWFLETLVELPPATQQDITHFCCAVMMPHSSVKKGDEMKVVPLAVLRPDSRTGDPDTLVLRANPVKKVILLPSYSTKEVMRKMVAMVPRRGYTVRDPC